MRSGNRRASGTVISTGRTKGYGEMLQAQEAARGEEVIKNDSSVVMRSSIGHHGNDTVVASGGRTQGYGEYLQQLEKERGEEVIKNDSSVVMRASLGHHGNDTVVSSGGRNQGYAERLQAEEAARGEEVIKNDSSVNMRSGNRRASGTIEALGGRGQGYAERLQAEEAARGEEVIKNDSSVIMRHSIGHANDTVEAYGRDYQRGMKEGSKGYAERLQELELEKGEEPIKNDSSVVMRASMGHHGNGTVEAGGRSSQGYAERLQAEEAARGEEVIKNDSSVIMRSSIGHGSDTIEAMGCDYQRGLRDADNGTYVSKDSGGSDSNSSPAGGNEMLDMLDKERRQELAEIMNNKSLNKEERKAAMDEAKERYADMAEALLS